MTQAFIAGVLHLVTYAQCPTNKIIEDNIKKIENGNLSYEKKSSQLSGLKEKADECNLIQDSVYAKLLSLIGAPASRTIARARAGATASTSRPTAARPTRTWV